MKECEKCGKEIIDKVIRSPSLNESERVMCVECGTKNNKFKMEKVILKKHSKKEQQNLLDRARKLLDKEY